MSLKLPKVDVQKARTIVNKLKKLRDDLYEFEKDYPYHKAFMTEHLEGVLEIGEFSADKKTQLLGRVASMYLASPEWRHLISTTINETNRILNEIEGKEKLNEAVKSAIATLPGKKPGVRVGRTLKGKSSSTRVHKNR